MVVPYLKYIIIKKNHDDTGNVERGKTGIDDKIAIVE